MNGIELIRGFDENVPDWDFFLNHLDYSNNFDGMLRIFNDNYFVSEVFDADVDKTKYAYDDVYQRINKMHKDGIQVRPVFLISIFSKIGNLGRHADPVDTVHWNCIGKSYWKIELLDGTIVEEILYPGDLIFITSGVQHEVTSLTPRAGITFSSNMVR